MIVACKKIARDKTATVKQRLRACEILAACYGITGRKNEYYEALQKRTKDSPNDTKMRELLDKAA